MTDSELYKKSQRAGAMSGEDERCEVDIMSIGRSVSDQCHSMVVESFAGDEDEFFV